MILYRNTSKYIIKMFKLIYLIPLLHLWLSIQAHQSRFTNTFQGCFSGPGHSLLSSQSMEDNLNARCIDYCRNKSHPVAVTKGPQCACSESLLEMLPRIARPEDGNATGSLSPCNQTCPGTPDLEQCDRDTCCGGPSAYSVFVVGNIDSVKAILDRSQSILEKDNFARLEKLWGSEIEEIADFTKKENTRLMGDFETSEAYNAAECFSKCKAQSKCQGSTMFETSKPKTERTNCYLFSPGSQEKHQSGWTTYLKGAEKDFGNAEGKRLKMHHYHIAFVSSPLYCRQLCLNNRDICGGATVNMTNKHERYECYLFNYGEFETHYQKGWYSFIFEEQKVEVETTATPLNSKGEQTGKKMCKKTKKTYSCISTTEKNPSAYMVLKATSMEQHLRHSLGTNLKPLGKYDFETDYTGTSQPAVVNKLIQITDSTESQWHTESGADVSYTIGGKITATAEKEKMFAKASLSAELSSEIKEGKFFSEGYSKTSTSTIREEVRVQHTVPSGAKLQINFYAESNQLQVKWRAKLIANGKVRVTFCGHHETFYLSEILSLKERTLFAFGTINFGDRVKIVSIEKEINENGDVLNTDRIVHNEVSVLPGKIGKTEKRPEFLNNGTKSRETLKLVAIIVLTIIIVFIVLLFFLNRIFSFLPCMFGACSCK